MPECEVIPRFPMKPFVPWCLFNPTSSSVLPFAPIVLPHWALIMPHRCLPRGICTGHSLLDHSSPSYPCGFLPPFLHILAEMPSSSEAISDFPFYTDLPCRHTLYPHFLRFLHHLTIFGLVHVFTFLEYNKLQESTVFSFVLFTAESPASRTVPSTY